MVVARRAFAVDVLQEGLPESGAQSSICHEHNNESEIGSHCLFCEEEEVGRRKEHRPLDCEVGFAACDKQESLLRDVPPQMWTQNSVLRFCSWSFLSTISTNDVSAYLPRETTSYFESDPYCILTGVNTYTYISYHPA